MTNLSNKLSKLMLATAMASAAPALMAQSSQTAPPVPSKNTPPNSNTSTVAASVSAKLNQGPAKELIKESGKAKQESPCGPNNPCAPSKKKKKKSGDGPCAPSSPCAPKK